MSCVEYLEKLMFANGAVFFRLLLVVPLYYPRMFQSPFLSVFLSRKNCWSCCNHVNITKLKVVLFLWRNFCFVPNRTLLQCPLCNVWLKSTSSIWVALPFSSTFLVCSMRRRHINLETTLSMSHLNKPVVIWTSLGPLPICILPMTAWIHGIVSFGLYLLFLYKKVV